MRVRLGLSVLALAILGAGTGAAIVIAGDSPAGPGQAPEPGAPRAVRAHPVPSPPALTKDGFARAAKKPRPPRKPALRYFETGPQSLPPGPTGFRIGNPKCGKAINGYYYLGGTVNGFGLDAQGDSPIRGLRQWAFYLNNTNPTPISGVIFGLICLRNVD